MNARLFAPDPIDFLDPTPYSFIEYHGHMIVGAIWFVASLVAFFAKKGSRLHIRAGQVCIIAILLIGLSALVMLAVEFIPPLTLNAFTSAYAVITAWLALKPASAGVRRAEIGFTVFEAIIFSAFLVLALPNVLSGTIPAIGPLTVALVPLILLAGDINWHRKQGERAKLRVRRHLARMIFAFAIVLRAPLVEFETAGFYDMPDPILMVGPVLLALVMLAWFHRRYWPRKDL